MGAIMMTIFFNLEDTFIDRALEFTSKINIAIAPAEGLMLNWVGYDVYNDWLVDRDIDRP